MNPRHDQLALWLCLVLAVAARAQSPAPVPKITKVEIVGPLGTPQNPYRTNRELLSIQFTSDASGGVFFAQSAGADIPLMTFLTNTSSGSVGAGFLTNGVHNVSVLLSTANSGITTQVSATSAPITVVFDTTPPTLTITQIRLTADGAFQPFDPNQQYQSNGKQIGLQGTVNDGQGGVPGPQITVIAAGISQPATTTPDQAGNWKLDVDLSKEPPGALQLTIVANDNVGGTEKGNVSQVPVLLK